MEEASQSVRDNIGDVDITTEVGRKSFFQLQQIKEDNRQYVEYFSNLEIDIKEEQTKRKIKYETKHAG